MIKINYFDERKLLVRREIETKTPKPKAPKCYPVLTMKDFDEETYKEADFNDVANECLLLHNIVVYV